MTDKNQHSVQIDFFRLVQHAQTATDVLLQTDGCKPHNCDVLRFILQPQDVRLFL